LLFGASLLSQERGIEAIAKKLYVIRLCVCWQRPGLLNPGHMDRSWSADPGEVLKNSNRGIYLWGQRFNVERMRAKSQLNRQLPDR
jgi:hypothetical protein